MKRRIFSGALILSGIVCAWGNAGEGTAGQDLLPVFARAHSGAPLRAVAIGGSITQAGAGWIGDWLAAQFPQSATVMHNAGMSGTGSALGMFRLERDVLACQPDLVLVEFVVNDGGEADEVAWTLESVVRRLKLAPNPPAVVLLEAGARQRPEGLVPPQRRVGDHYGLLSIDLQAAVRRRLAEDKKEWETFFGDDVHPNAAGHQFYSEVISAQLQPYVEQARNFAAAATAASLPPPPPPPLSPRPLILDGRLMPIAVGAGWKREHSVPGWWTQWFPGAVASREVGAGLVIPFRGTVVGLFYSLDEKYGLLHASVDGGDLQEIVCNHRKGFSYQLLGKELSAGEHRLHLAIPENGAGAEGVKLGYVLVGGAEGAGAELAPQGPNTGERLVRMPWLPIPAAAWAWVGPFGDVSAAWPPADQKLAHLDQAFWPEVGLGERPALQPAAGIDSPVRWKKVEGSGLGVDLRALTGFGDRGVSYAWTEVVAPAAQKGYCRLIVDYYAKLWLNGQLVYEARTHHGAPAQALVFPLELRAGANQLVLKVHSGSRGNLFMLTLQDEGKTLRANNPLQ